MPKRICFLVYEDWEEALLDLDDKTFRELVTSIFKYGFRKEESALSPMARMAMKLIKPVLDRDWEKFEERCNRNKTNGLQGGRPKTQTVSEKPKKPSGLFQNPENPVAPINEKEYMKNKKEINEKGELLLDDKSSLATSVEVADPKIDYKGIMEFYNQSVKGTRIAKMRVMTEERRKAIHARIVTYGIDAVYEVITKAVHSRFLCGDNDENWAPDAVWLFGPKNFLKVYEGKYDNDRMMHYGNRGSSKQATALRTGTDAAADLFAELEASRRIQGTDDQDDPTGAISVVQK